MQPLKFGVGQSVVRKEDDTLLRGRGRYVADTAPRGTLHAVVLRSPHAHAGFHIDVAKARAVPGVRLVLTGADTSSLGQSRPKCSATKLRLFDYLVGTRQDGLRHLYAECFCGLEIDGQPKFGGKSVTPLTVLYSGE
jgi:CO/xanthine dehydrogenase Mo-binding subunit